MGLSFRGDEILFIDTAPVIYYIENHPQFSSKMDALIDAVANFRQQWITSFVTYVEVLALPRKMKDQPMEQLYTHLLTQTRFLKIVQTNPSIMNQCVHFRAEYGFKTPDAIQLATAQVFGADIVITNDHAWKKITELRVVTLDEL
ncbi:MAG: PIN domain-containing protein [Kiritimatiellaceae bacterium]|nr:PIN domain-containing protein [Kiritimatiellaceae bacterium]